jgi:hypothetical protein
MAICATDDDRVPVYRLHPPGHGAIIATNRPKWWKFDRSKISCGVTSVLALFTFVALDVYLDSECSGRFLRGTVPNILCEILFSYYPVQRDGIHTYSRTGCRKPIFAETSSGTCGNMRALIG